MEAAIILLFLLAATIQGLQFNRARQWNQSKEARMQSALHVWMKLGDREIRTEGVYGK